MQSSSRAPVLSATFSLDSCWIIGRQAFSTISARRQHLVFDSGRVSTMRTVSPIAGLVGLVVRVELHRAPDDLLVARVQLGHVDLDDDRLVGLVGDDDAAALLAGRAVVLGLRQADDRLALLQDLARRNAALPPVGARNVLAATSASWQAQARPRSATGPPRRLQALPPLRPRRALRPAASSTAASSTAASSAACPRRLFRLRPSLLGRVFDHSGVFDQPPPPRLPRSSSSSAI